MCVSVCLCLWDCVLVCCLGERSGGQHSTVPYALLASIWNLCSVWTHGTQTHTDTLTHIKKERPYRLTSTSFFALKSSIQPKDSQADNAMNETDINTYRQDGRTERQIENKNREGTEREMENAYSCDQVLEVCPKQSFLYNKSVCTGIIL